MRIKCSEYKKNVGLGEKMRFAFVSDLHDCPNEPVLEMVKRASPDYILVGGDFVHNAERWERGIEFLREAAMIAPTYESIGNHERNLGDSLFGRVAGTGAVLLDDSFVKLGRVVVGGLSSGYPDGPHGREKTTPMPHTDWLADYTAQEGFKLLLCHHPEYYENIVKPLPIDLTLSGHAHGGQWRFFGRGVFAPGQGIFPKYSSGEYDGGRLIVGRGLGNPYPIPRIFNPPEIIVFTLD